MREHLDRLLAGHEARRVQAVETDVGQRPAAGLGPLVAPLPRGVGRHRLDIAGGETDDASEGAVLHELAHPQVMRLVLDAIGHHQADTGLGAGRDHGTRIGGAGGQWLLAQHVLASRRRALHVFTMHGVGQHDIHRLDLWVVAQLVEVGIAVAGLGRDAVLTRHRRHLLRRTGDQGRHPGLATLGECRQQLLQRQPAEADDREADALRRRQRCRRRRARAVGLAAPWREDDLAVLDATGIDRRRPRQALRRRGAGREHQTGGGGGAQLEHGAPVESGSEGRGHGSMGRIEERPRPPGTARRDGDGWRPGFSPWAN